MNLENVKYPWVLAKYKDDAWDVELRNFEAVPDSQLAELHHHAVKALFSYRRELIRQRDREKD